MQNGTVVPRIGHGPHCGCRAAALHPRPRVPSWLLDAVGYRPHPATHPARAPPCRHCPREPQTSISLGAATDEGPCECSGEPCRLCTTRAIGERSWHLRSGDRIVCCRLFLGPRSTCPVLHLCGTVDANAGVHRGLSSAGLHRLADPGPLRQSPVWLPSNAQPFAAPDSLQPPSATSGDEANPPHRRLRRLLCASISVSRTAATRGVCGGRVRSHELRGIHKPGSAVAAGKADITQDAGIIVS